MSHSETLEAIVLHVRDVGEADRYVVLFTKERGRLALRARAVRKLKSRMGGALIPFHHVRVAVKKTSAGNIAAGAAPVSINDQSSLRTFADASQGFEVLLRLVQDGEPLPAVFNASIAFLKACAEEVPHASLAYTFRLLDILGLLPAEAELVGREALSGEEREFLHLAREGYFLRVPSLQNARKLLRVRDRYLQEQLSSPLRAPGVAAAMRS